MSQITLECRPSCPFNYGCGENFSNSSQPCESTIRNIANIIKSDKGGRVALFTDSKAVGDGVKICIPKNPNSDPWLYDQWKLVAVAFNGYLEYRGFKTDRFSYPSI